MAVTAVVASALALTACAREPSFDERFANASATVANQSAAMDEQMRALEARERADRVAPAPPPSSATAEPAADTRP